MLMITSKREHIKKQIMLKYLSKLYALGSVSLHMHTVLDEVS
jgi:hypothetical protein